MYRKLQQKTLELNNRLSESGLILFTWGNASVYDPETNVFAIKPSGIPYSELRVEDMVVMGLDGEIREGTKKPSSDTPTHLELYCNFSEVRAIIHTHSKFATAYAQAKKPIRCLGTTHADAFFGDIPVTRDLMVEEITHDYEKNTGRVIVEQYKSINPLSIPACLVASHGPFVWGDSPDHALHNAILLEYLAEMNINSERLNPIVQSIPQILLAKHYERKHGGESYYGQ